MAKKILFIHGLASKPAKETLRTNWEKCLAKNLELFNGGPVGTPYTCKMAYWANAIPNHLEDTDDTVGKVAVRIDELLKKRESFGNDFHVGKGAKFRAFFKDKALDVVDFFGTALTIKDEVSEMFLQEVRYYKNDQYIADKIRKTLEDELIEAWENGDDVALLSHSMGTFIAYDVLWRFSHKNVAPYNRYRDRKVDLFVTMGSPLGDKTIQDLLFAEHHKDERRYPNNVATWYNFSALGDIVSHDSTLKDDFIAHMQKSGILGADSNDYVKLYNPFMTPEKTRNPHKSYGYLVQPKLAQRIMEFLNA